MDSHHKVMMKDYALDPLLDPMCLGMPILKYYVLIRLMIWFMWYASILLEVRKQQIKNKKVIDH